MIEFLFSHSNGEGLLKLIEWKLERMEKNFTKKKRLKEACQIENTKNKLKKILYHNYFVGMQNNVWWEKLCDEQKEECIRQWTKNKKNDMLSFFMSLQNCVFTWKI